MTPFGEKLRAIRAARNLALKDMAAGLQVSPAYLSAMEHGRRGKPSRRFVHRVCQFLGIIWDDAEELQNLADLSHPRVAVDTAGLSPRATLLANLLAERIATMDAATLERLLALVDPSSPASETEGEQGAAGQSTLREDS
ncbi:helix-turn-helix transcriptional regulator [Pelagibius litoralis]|uniref:Helix-turn-helix transcriptional regulator n=1 Tax=Pelagibius litoralis TaxID=374515 RepID=A0A967F2D5_9PROT|nr:helix-turn-helix transcriptional regulator [Pelagibius litoralis]NIA71732.1 helix-turn-helix transcriptional regulator [Pelagibius litoralis]